MSANHGGNARQPYRRAVVGFPNTSKRNSCPKYASSMTLPERLQERFGAGAPAVGSVAMTETIEMMLGHRSCRSFSDEAVSGDVVRVVLAAALSAPSKSDLQQVTIIWLTDPAQRRAVLALSPNNAWACSIASLPIT